MDQDQDKALARPRRLEVDPDEPSRLLVVSRGWLGGHPLSHEIQGVYAITGGELVLLHWRERDR